MIQELNFLARISKIDYNIHETIRITAKNKLIIHMDTIEALYTCQSKADKQNMHIIGALVAYYNSF